MTTEQFVEELARVAKGYLGYDLSETNEIIAPQIVRAILARAAEIGPSREMKDAAERINHARDEEIFSAMLSAASKEG